MKRKIPSKIVDQAGITSIEAFFSSFCSLLFGRSMLALVENAASGASVGATLSATGLQEQVSEKTSLRASWIGVVWRSIPFSICATSSTSLRSAFSIWSRLGRLTLVGSNGQKELEIQGRSNLTLSGGQIYRISLVDLGKQDKAPISLKVALPPSAKIPKLQLDETQISCLAQSHKITLNCVLSGKLERDFLGTPVGISAVEGRLIGSERAINGKVKFFDNCVSFVLGEWIMEERQEVAEKSLMDESILASIQIGEIELSLSELMTLRPGMTIECPIEAKEILGTLMVAGTPWGKVKVNIENEKINLNVQEIFSLEETFDSRGRTI